MNRISDPLKIFIETYGNVETYDPEIIRLAIRPGAGYHSNLILMREQLLTAINDELLSVAEMEYLTHNAFDGRDEAISWLRELLACMS
jgi:hypothetical protein